MEPAYAKPAVRWIFEDYVVYANSRRLAEQIRDHVRSHHGVRVVFGMEEMPTGTGYWVKKVTQT